MSSTLELPPHISRVGFENWCGEMGDRTVVTSSIVNCRAPYGCPIESFLRVLGYPDPIVLPSRWSSPVIRGGASIPLDDWAKEVVNYSDQRLWSDITGYDLLGVLLGFRALEEEEGK